MYRIIACLAALVALTGCGGEVVHRSAAPSRAASGPIAVPSVAATKVPPLMPHAAKVNSTAGATAFADYYLEVRNYALRSGDTTVLTSITAPTCLLCLWGPQLIESTYRAGGHIEGGLWVRTTDVSPLSNDPGGAMPKGMGFLQVSIHLTPMRVLSPEGRVTGTYEGSNHDRALTISTSWDHGRWVLDQILTVSGQML